MPHETLDRSWWSWPCRACCRGRAAGRPGPPKPRRRRRRRRRPGLMAERWSPRCRRPRRCGTAATSNGFMAPYAECSDLHDAGGPHRRRRDARPLPREGTSPVRSPTSSSASTNWRCARLAPTTRSMTGRFTLAGGGKAEQTGRFSLVWLRTAGGWRILARSQQLTSLRRQSYPRILGLSGFPGAEEPARHRPRNGRSVQRGKA